MSFARNTSITLIAQYLSLAAAAAAAVIIATKLGPAGAGTYTMVRVLPSTVAALLGAGMTIANPFMIGRRKHPVQAITETTVAIGLLISGLAYLGWVLCAGVLQARFFNSLPAGMVLVIGLLIPLNMLRDYLNSIQQGLQTFKGANLVLCMDDFASLLLVLPLFWGIGGGNLLVVVAVVGGVAASCLTAVVLLLRRGIKPWPWLHRPIAVEAVRFGIKGHIGRMANMLNMRLDVVILRLLASNEVVGIYAVAFKVAELFRPLSASLIIVLRPLIASLSVAEARARGVELYRRVFTINFVAVAIMAVIGGPLIVRLFGEAFASSVPAFRILLIGLAAQGADGVVNGYNVGIGRPEFNSYTALVAVLLTVTLDLTLIPAFGVIGAAVASTVAYTAKAITMTAIFLSTSGVTFSQLVGVKEYSPDPI
jgi:O-antigen/teichoic acid export membrane protein